MSEHVPAAGAAHLLTCCRAGRRLGLHPLSSPHGLLSADDGVVRAEAATLQRPRQGLRGRRPRDTSAAAAPEY
ncbi:hypothetical protein MSG28_001861 [Choristoneura fumiferana]|uniref:Uncharacterized protein n=1 Tax=Choristoneura fumiferana TaxID=7141 RepID=A0ACC0KWH8_CHOFU|nr:hypothetical protein MSG28_001861 [Choristoneura fumiferana]